MCRAWRSYVLWLLGYIRIYHLAYIKQVKYEIRIYLKVPYEYTWKYHTNIPESTIRIYPKVRYEYTWKYHTNMWICHTFFGCVIDLIWIKLYFIFDCTRFYSTVFDCTRKYHNLYSIILANIRLYVTLRLSHDVSV